LPLPVLGQGLVRDEDVEQEPWKKKKGEENTKHTQVSQVVRVNAVVISERISRT
jgi:hypothetical protein